MSQQADMKDFLDRLLAGMTLEQKIGQLNYPNATAVDTTGVGKSADAPELIRRGQLCGISAGAGQADRRELQRIAVEEGPNGIPLLIGKDCIQRYHTGGPIPLALACSWDMDLIHRVNRMTATEARADGININWAPMLDICYDARWGRMAEGNGELPFLGARIAETIVRAYQGEDNDMARPDRFMATLKHFCGYGLAMAGRDYSAVEASVSTLYRIMEPFRAGIEAGAGAIMVSFNTINDMPATAHVELLQKVLRGRFGFRGLIVTDFAAIDPELVNHGIAEDSRQAAYLAFKAGVNVDLVSEAFLHHLADLVAEGATNPERFRQAYGAYALGPITEADVTQRCHEVLEAKYRLGLFENPYLGLEPERLSAVTYTAQNIALVREAVARSCVLLKNDGVLPLKREGTLAVIGPIADDRIDMQGTWAIDVDPAHSVTLVEGIRNVAGSTVQVIHAKGCNIIDDPSLACRLNMHNANQPSVVIGNPAHLMAEALDAAADADVILLCLGEAKEHAGESSTRIDVQIPLDQRPLFDAIASYAAAAGKPLVLIAMAGRPLALSHELEAVNALIFTGHPGNEAGHGLADVIFGDRAPVGRLAFALPRHTGQLPFRTEALPTGRPITGIGVSLDCDTALDAAGHHVFRKFTTACILETPSTPLFPAGFGLGYTQFAYDAPEISATALQGDDAVLTMKIAVRNTGERAGEDVVQLYLHDKAGKISRPALQLCGFERLKLAPGETHHVEFRIGTDTLRFWHGATLANAVHDWEPGEFVFLIGPDSDRLQSAGVRWYK
ncbi:glycoside hydrolase family 3 N-terminal domain-containing protein [Aestuariivirga sp.]|uniref:glycoside hydrolase family 3 N-terminal domain-containing protein n=1 Tax=Aestuariivirga sp. TaxID=2650926 RepID=UPI0039E34844